MEELPTVCRNDACRFRMGGRCPSGRCAVPPAIKEPVKSLALAATAKALAQHFAAEEYFYVLQCTVIMIPAPREWGQFHQECCFPQPDDLDWIQSLDQTVKKLKDAVASSVEQLPLPSGIKQTLDEMTTYYFFLGRFQKGLMAADVREGMGYNAARLEQEALGAEFRLHLAAGLAFCATRCLLGGKDACFYCRYQAGPDVPLICLSHIHVDCCFMLDRNLTMAFHISFPHSLISFTLTQDHRIADHQIHVIDFMIV